MIANDKITEIISFHISFRVRNHCHVAIKNLSDFIILHRIEDDSIFPQ